MPHAREFRDFAQDCVRSARETRSEQHRDALTKLAASWRRAALEIIPISGVARRKRATFGLRFPQARDASRQFRARFDRIGLCQPSA